MRDISENSGVQSRTLSRQFDTSQHLADIEEEIHEIFKNLCVSEELP
jgi:hypothetical protein